MEKINSITTIPAMEQVKQAQELKQLKAAGESLEKTAGNADTARDASKLKDACVQFEAMFLDLMYKEMRKTVPEDSLLGDSNADNILRSMHDTEMTKNLAQAGGVGLADMLYRQIQKQDVKPPLMAVNTYKK
ncbi:rod-binding protein [Pectinatus haikarae]|uniref:Flagellar protein FlgJ n=1 Tax=Pectinatus haikarae TaxID=349096 RepID=A0ABT9Y765_9FIRM|nr:rod-binding protein [Pectinatus haikarae]MDQ0203067.1 flagellar protein FlgJ [Pectinatus haikarae]